MAPNAPSEPETAEQTPPDESGDETTEPGSRRTPAVSRRLLMIAAPLAALGAAAAIWLAATGNSDKPRPEEKVPTYPVAYTVTGTGSVDIAYAPGGKHQTVHKLPWSHQVAMPADGRQPTLTLILGADGGHAQCTLRMHGKVVQHAIARGRYGRATCQTSGRSQDNSPSADSG